MASKLVYDLVANTGEYTDRSGNAKKRYLTCGKVFENEQGHLSVKLECVPTGPDWSGWFSLFVPKDKSADPAPVTEHSAAKANAFVDDGDVPF